MEENIYEYLRVKELAEQVIFEIRYEKISMKKISKFQKEMKRRISVLNKLDPIKPIAKVTIEIAMSDKELKKIHAVKNYRDKMGVTISVAKKAVEDICGDLFYK